MNPPDPATQTLCTDDRRIQRADCVHCPIRHRMLFADLDMQAAKDLLAPVSNTSYQAEDVIYQQGQQASSLYSIRKGVVKLSMISAAGELRIVRLLGPGAAIGLEVLLEQSYQHTAEALSTVDVCRIPAATIRRIALQQPQLHQRLMRQWQQQIHLADQHLLSLSTGAVRHRVISLLGMLDDIGRRGNTPMLLPSNRDCAALVGATVESVSRHMAEFKRAGILQQRPDTSWQFILSTGEGD